MNLISIRQELEYCKQIGYEYEISLGRYDVYVKILHNQKSIEEYQVFKDNRLYDLCEYSILEKIKEYIKNNK